MKTTSLTVENKLLVILVCGSLKVTALVTGDGTCPSRKELSG